MKPDLTNSVADALEEAFPMLKADGYDLQGLAKRALEAVQWRIYALDEWLDKTEWVQEDFNKGLIGVGLLGKHRADVMREEIERLRAAPASAQPDRGAAQGNECEHCEDGYVYDTGHTRRMPCRDCAPSPASQPVAPEATDLLDALQKAARLLRAAGFAMTGTATSQIVAAIEAHAQQEAAPACRWPTCLPEAEQDKLADEVMHSLAGEVAVAPSDAKDETVPDHSERGAANAVNLASRIEALRTALREISETNFGWDGDCGVARIADDALYDDEQVATIAAGQEAANAKDAARYRWLRDCENQGPLSIGRWESSCPADERYEAVDWLYGDDLDAAIDAAMTKEATDDR